MLADPPKRVPLADELNVLPKVGIVDDGAVVVAGVGAVTAAPVVLPKTVLLAEGLPEKLENFNI